MKIKLALLFVIVSMLVYILFDSLQQNTSQTNEIHTLVLQQQENEHFSENVASHDIKQAGAIAINISNVDLDKVEDRENDNQSIKHPSSIKPHIKNKLCIDDNDLKTCTVDLEKDFISALINSAGLMKTEEILVVLNSENFDDVLLALSSKKYSNEAFIREDKYQYQLRKIAPELDIAITPIFCSEAVCALTIEYTQAKKSKQFVESFFSNSYSGPIFVAELLSSDKKSAIERIMFFPGIPKGALIAVED